MMLPALLFLMGIACLCFGWLQLRDFRNRQGDFGEWIVSDASPPNRKLWRTNRMVQMTGLFVGGTVCLAAFGSLMLK